MAQNKVKKKKKVLVAISGGVDSAVTAKMLLDASYDVSAIFLNFWKEEGLGLNENKCCSIESQMDAKKVCLKLGIPFYTLNFSKRFKLEVVDNFVSEYSQGMTPNPCVLCNKKVKIGALLDYALSMGFDYLATGHYVINEKDDKEYCLKRAKDIYKDQSYFLYTLNQKQLSHLLFPLGKYKKSQVRAMAHKADLDVASKSDSQEICFISGKRHNDFLKRHIDLKEGDMVLLPDNKVVARHKGLPLYTIGQRRGIEIGGDGPYYAAKFDYTKNILYLVKNFDDDILYSKEMTLKNISWTSDKKIAMPFKCHVVIRYHHKAVACTVYPGLKKGELKVVFYRKQRAVTPGQSAVFYSGDIVLGGGIIK